MPRLPFELMAHKTWQPVQQDTELSELISHSWTCFLLLDFFSLYYRYRRHKGAMFYLMRKCFPRQLNELVDDLRSLSLFPPLSTLPLFGFGSLLNIILFESSHLLIFEVDSVEFIIILKLKESRGTAMASPSYHRQQKVKAQSFPGPSYKKFDFIYKTLGGNDIITMYLQSILPSAGSSTLYSFPSSRREQLGLYSYFTSQDSVIITLRRTQGTEGFYGTFPSLPRILLGEVIRSHSEQSTKRNSCRRTGGLSPDHGQCLPLPTSQHGHAGCSD